MSSQLFFRVCKIVSHVIPTGVLVPEFDIQKWGCVDILTIIILLN
jgi:hypothetical protein